MTVTIVGVLADELGAASQITVIPYGGPSAGRNFDCRREYFSVSSLHYRSVQAAAINVDRDHDQVIGEVKYLERAPNGQLHAVCEIDGADLDGPLYFSPAIRYRDGGRDVELRGLALTATPATIGLPPVDAVPGTIADAATKVVYQHGFAGQLIRRAREYDRRRKRGEPLVIQGTHARGVSTAPAPESTTFGRQIWTRSAATVDVHRARRELDLLIMPAEIPAVIYERDRSYTEVFSHGAFRGIEHDPGKIRLNRNHQRDRLLGKATVLNPWDEQGLTGTVRLSRVAEADEALALIDDQLLGVSAGFAVHPSAGSMESRGNHRRIRRAILDHVSLVAEPAYSAATVTAVRRRQATPRLDAVLELLADAR